MMDSALTLITVLLIPSPAPLLTLMCITVRASYSAKHLVRHVHSIVLSAWSVIALLYFRLSISNKALVLSLRTVLLVFGLLLPMCYVIRADSLV